MPMEEEIAEMIEAEAKELTGKIARNFPTVGSVESSGDPVVFVPGVQVEKVVQFILWQKERAII